MQRAFDTSHPPASGGRKGRGTKQRDPRSKKPSGSRLSEEYTAWSCSAKKGPRTSQTTGPFASPSEDLEHTRCRGPGNITPDDGGEADTSPWPEGQGAGGHHPRSPTECHNEPVHRQRPTKTTRNPTFPDGGDKPVPQSRGLLTSLPAPEVRGAGGPYSRLLRAQPCPTRKQGRRPAGIHRCRGPGFVSAADGGEADTRPWPGGQGTGGHPSGSPTEKTRNPTFLVRGDRPVPQSRGLLTSLPSPVPARTQRVMGPGGGRAVQQPAPGIALHNMETTGQLRTGGVPCQRPQRQLTEP